METLQDKAKRFCDGQVCDTCMFKTGNPIPHIQCTILSLVLGVDVLGDVSKLEEWAEKNPAKTYWDEFSEKFPMAIKGQIKDGNLGCPQEIFHGLINWKGYVCPLGSCYECWLAPLGSLNTKK